MQPTTYTQQYHESPNWTQWWLLVTLSFHILSPQHITSPYIAPPPKVLWIILGMHVTESVQALRINSSLLNYPRRGFVAPKRLLLKNISIFYGNVLIFACPKCLEVNRALFWFVLKSYGSSMATEPKSRDQPQQKGCISNPGNTEIPPFHHPPKNDPQGSIWPLAVTNFHEDSASHDQLCQTLAGDASTQEIRQPWAALLYMQANKLGW